MATGLCFACGSNSAAEDWRAWCARNSVDPNSLSLLGTAKLPDRCLVFDTCSTGRAGFVLTTRARLGSYIEGVLLRPTEAGWDALDRERDALRSYERVSRTVILPDGAAVAAIVHDPAPLEAAARGEEFCQGLPDVFAYGTLMQGEVRHPPARRAGLVSITPARTRGRLHDFGPYPGMVLDATAREIEGELLTFRDPAAALPMLDRIEEARPGCAPGGPYRRTILTVTDASGRARPAWAYVVERARVAAAPIIASGSWRRR